MPLPTLLPCVGWGWVPRNGRICMIVEWRKVKRHNLEVKQMGRGLSLGNDEKEESMVFH